MAVIHRVFNYVRDRSVSSCHASLFEAQALATVLKLHEEEVSGFLPALTIKEGLPLESVELHLSQWVRGTVWLMWRFNQSSHIPIRSD